MKNQEYCLSSCNIEGDRHTESVEAMVKQYSPDIICLQEAEELLVNNIANSHGYELIFRPSALIDKSLYPTLNRNKIIGLALLSKIHIFRSGVYTYRNDTDKVPVYLPGNPNSVRKELLFATLANGFTIATTHFTWAPNGKVTSFQLVDIIKLKQAIKELGEIIFTADLNSPRPNQIYTQINNILKDNIPQNVDTTLDPKLHRNKTGVKLVVDYLFTSKSYLVTEIALITGISDHKAIIAKIKSNINGNIGIS